MKLELLQLSCSCKYLIILGAQLRPLSTMVGGQGLSLPGAACLQPGSVWPIGHYSVP